MDVPGFNAIINHHAGSGTIGVLSGGFRDGLCADQLHLTPVVRDEMRARIGKFLEIYVEAPLDVCRRRDINGVYRRAASGEIHNVTRLDDPYEPPLSPDVVRHTGHETPEDRVAKVLDRVESWIAHTCQLQ